MELEHIPPMELKPYDKNPRINDHSVDAVARSITEFGFNCPIVIGPDNRICAGHTRWKAAMKLGLETVPVCRVDALVAEKFVAFNIADNQTASLAMWDEDILPELLAELKEAAVRLPSLGFSDQELKSLMCERDPFSVDSNSHGQSSEPVTRPGDFYTMGEHCLFCGDAFSSTFTELVSYNGNVDCVFAGPPIFGQLQLSEHTNYGAYLHDMERLIASTFECLKKGGISVWHVGNCSNTHHDNAAEISMLLKQAGFIYRDSIAWAKPSANYGVGRNCHIQQNGHYYPAFQWDALLVYQRPGPMPKMTREGKSYMAKHHTNLWDISGNGNAERNSTHPAPCPVEIPYRVLQAYSRPGQTVLDPFAGSGSTLIAAEKTGRKAVLVEKSCAFCDAIVERLGRYTGQTANRTSGALTHTT